MPSSMASSLQCTPTSTTTTLTFATSGVTVGTLTDMALSTAIASAIDSACSPPPTATNGAFTCDENAVVTVSPSIQYVSNDGDKHWDDKGSLTLQFKVGAYDSLVWYETAKGILAAAVSNSTQGNCKQLTADGVSAAENYEPTAQTFTNCKAASFWQLSTSDSNPDPSGSGDVTPANEFAFDLGFVVDPDADFSCKFVEDIVEFLETTVNAATDTEAAIPGELKIDDELLKACEGATNSRVKKV